MFPAHVIWLLEEPTGDLCLKDDPENPLEGTRPRRRGTVTHGDSEQKGNRGHLQPAAFTPHLISSAGSEHTHGPGRPRTQNLERKERTSQTSNHFLPLGPIKEAPGFSLCGQLLFDNTFFPDLYNLLSTYEVCVHLLSLTP